MLSTRGLRVCALNMCKLGRALKVHQKIGLGLPHAEDSPKEDHYHHIRAVCTDLSIFGTMIALGYLFVFHLFAS